MTKKLRLLVVKLACWLCLPEEIWVGKTVGVYTQKVFIQFGKLDARGILQGLNRFARESPPFRAGRDSATAMRQFLFTTTKQ
ncbi:hypothetical protein ACJU26_08795 [Acidithiobacillus sp. M4-SHS-6]|uniref:hypothetical protein n=1 Tax=Acidithiobacillus sp. M4-SHS-6 TaxID=3383024 RepID=UPI0039BDAE7F